MDIVRSKCEDYIIDSNIALEFKLVRDREDLENEAVSFKPEMSHQIFGDSENIFGYKDLKVKVYFTAAKLSVYLGLEYTEKIDPKKFDEVEPDNVTKLLGEKLPSGVLTNLDEFVKDLESESSFLPYGELLNSFTVAGENNTSRSFEIYYCDSTNKKFLNYHERLQTFILFYIDAASFIDVDDEKWRFFVIYEKYKNKNGETMYAVCGYATCYIYYAYPANIRPRVSQMLVLPPFQKIGLGTQLLCAIYNYYIPQTDVLDITVEDPNEEFQQLRDYVDVCRCEKLACLAVDRLKNGFSPEMAQQMQQIYKINKRQARRVYEILRLKSTNILDSKELQEFRLDVKKRLNIPFQSFQSNLIENSRSYFVIHSIENFKNEVTQKLVYDSGGFWKHLWKEKAYMKKMTPLMNDPQYQLTLGLNSAGQRLETLDKLFKETLNEYQKVLERISERPLVV